MEIHALSDMSFFIEKGEFVVIVGPSGAGKTTVLNILGGMDTATDGKVVVDGVDVSALRGKQLVRYRREEVGFVFQFYNLMQNLTALENVELALQISKKPLDAETVLQEVGLADRKNNFPSQLSGGEQQRVAIARARQKSQTFALRRTDGRARLRDGQGGFKAVAGYLPRTRHDGHHHHAQQRTHAHGGQGDPRAQRKSFFLRGERSSRFRRADRVVRRKT